MAAMTVLFVLFVAIAVVWYPWRAVKAAARLGWVLIVTLVAIIMLAGAAHAGQLSASSTVRWRPAPITRTWRTGFTDAAISYWHRPAECGRPIIRLRDWTPVGVPGIQADSDGWVYDNGPQTCAIYLLANYWRGLLRWDPLRACMLYAHEYAHLLGLPDEPHGLLAHDVRHQHDRPCRLLVLHRTP